MRAKTAAFSTALFALLCCAGAPAANQPYPPAAVMAALSAQAAEIPSGRIENCTPGGIAAGTDEANKNIAAGDWGRLAQVQYDYATGFARCALSAGYPSDFYVFAGATSVSLGNALFGLRQANARVDAVEKTVAGRVRTLAGFLIEDPSTNQGQKDQQVGVLNLLSNIGL